MEEKRLAKNELISQTKRETIKRHSNMICKTFDVKIQENKLSKAQKEVLSVVFLEQKWYKNYILNWSDSNPENKIWRFDTKIKHITKKDKDMNDVPVEIKHLTAQSRQCLISRMASNIKTLSTLKKKGLQRPGKLKFSKEETVIDFKQPGTFRAVSSKRMKLPGIPKAVPVNGLDQFLDIPGLEFANARLLKKATGYYVQFVCYLPKASKNIEKINETIGIDFGCSTSFTLSNGEKIDAKVPESERLKKCQRTLAKKVKGSKNWYREVQKIRKEYQRQTNRKNDLANKLVHRFTQFETVVIQDEQLQGWHKGGHGKAVQHSVLGRVKSKLKEKSNVVILSKMAPTTKVCTNCGTYHDNMKLWDRTFECDCGVKMDRDVHAAQNMVWMYENNVGVERTKIKRVEMEALINAAIGNKDQLLSEKHEDSSF